MTLPVCHIIWRSLGSLSEKKEQWIGIDAMRVFARVVARGSFVRAAEDLRLPASTATDAVKQLEARLGVRLLQRTTRQVRATLDGEAYYRRCLSILDDVEEAESAFRGARPAPCRHSARDDGGIGRVRRPLRHATAVGRAGWPSDDWLPLLGDRRC